MKRALLIGSVLAVALAVSATGVSQAEENNRGSQAPSISAECIQSGKSGHQIWKGQPSVELNSVADSLQALVDANPDVATGVAYCSRYEGVAVFMSPGADQPLLDEIDAIRQSAPDQVVFVSQVAASLSELLDASSQIIDTNGVVSVTPDITIGGLSIGYDKNVWASADALQAKLPAQAEAARGKAMPLRFAEERAPEDTTRRADSEPYYMGAELAYGTSVCSAGAPITINGSRKLLTAGHCTGSSFTNNGNLVGTTYTTAYPGNADIYGDWKLIDGKSYGTRVFSGSLSSSESLQISGANWAGRPAGSGVCSSGRTTAQICRFVVQSSYGTITSSSGVTANHILRMYHDSDMNGTGDNSGFAGGDSGGSCYYSDGSGGVTLTGIVKAVLDPASGPNVYYCTQLSGVRAWNSSVTVP